MTYDLIVAGGTVATASDVFRADVAIRDGRIAAIGDGLTGAAETIDATGRLVLPGGIDSHVHFAQPSGEGIVMADDFETGTLSLSASLYRAATHHRPCRFLLPAARASLSREGLA